MGLSPWGSFEGWSSLVRSAVVWIGMEDPAKTRDELARTADTELTALADLITGWEEMCVHISNSSGGCTAAMALEALGKDEAESRLQVRGVRFASLRSALGELISTPPGKLPTAAKVGALFRRLRGRVVDGKKLTPGLRAGNNFWFVVAAAAGAGGGGGHGGRDEGHSGGTQGNRSPKTDSTHHPRNDPGEVHHDHQVHRTTEPPPAAAVAPPAPPENHTSDREVFEL
jgi:hypothetical protein